MFWKSIFLYNFHCLGPCLRKRGWHFDCCEFANRTDEMNKSIVAERLRPEVALTFYAAKSRAPRIKMGWAVFAAQPLNRPCHGLVSTRARSLGQDLCLWHCDGSGTVEKSQFSSSKDEDAANGRVFANNKGWTVIGCPAPTCFSGPGPGSHSCVARKISLRRGSGQRPALGVSDGCGHFAQLPRDEGLGTGGPHKPPRQQCKLGEYFSFSVLG